MVGLVAVGLPALYFGTTIFGYGCGDAEERLAGALSREAVLDAVPDGAGRRETYDSCDDDDTFVVVGARYGYTGPTAGVTAHYRRAAVAEGWRAATTPGCYTKAVGGTTAYLQVEDPADGVFHVEIVADRAASEWC
jgi:hypothetical protein